MIFKKFHPAFLFIPAYFFSPTPPAAPWWIQVTHPTMQLHIIRMEKNLHHYHFDISYPSFGNAYPTLNRLIEKRVIDTIRPAIHGEDVIAAVAANASSHATHSYELTYRVIQANKYYISVVFAYRMIGEQAAHGQEFWDTYTYDLQHQRELLLVDLLPARCPPDFFFQRAAQLCLRELSQSLNPDHLDPEAIEDALRSTNLFTFTGDLITFYFQQYKIYSYCDNLSVTLTTAELFDPFIA